MMKDFVADPGLDPVAPSHGERGDADVHELAPAHLASWLEEQSEFLAERWLAEIGARGGGLPSEVESLLERFLGLFVSFLPASLGPYHEQVDPLWRQAAELFGSVGAMRGLAAGEIIEEFQLLREGLIRLVHADPPGGRGGRIPLRETVRLNRIVDRGVTHASVAHTDSLFFALFQGTGVPETLSPRVIEEVREQLSMMEREFRALMRLLDE